MKLFKRSSIFEQILLLKFFIIVTISFWKSDRPVSKVKQSSKHFELLVKNKSIQEGFLTFLKQVGTLFGEFSLYWLQSAFIFASLGSTIKSSISSVFSYFLLYVSNDLPISPRWIATLILLGLCEQLINHLRDFSSISMKKASIIREDVTF